jgi:hypothetical protein
MAIVVSVIVGLVTFFVLLAVMRYTPDDPDDD